MENKDASQQNMQNTYIIPYSSHRFHRLFKIVRLKQCAHDLTLFTKSESRGLCRNPEGSESLELITALPVKYLGWREAGCSVSLPLSLRLGRLYRISIQYQTLSLLLLCPVLVRGVLG